MKRSRALSYVIAGSKVIVSVTFSVLIVRFHVAKKKPRDVDTYTIKWGSSQCKLLILNRFLKQRQLINKKKRERERQ